MQNKKETREQIIEELEELRKQVTYLEERLKEKSELKAKRSMRLASLGSLATGIAHEINQPLTAILTKVDGILFLDELKKEVSREDLVESLRDVSTQAKRIIEIITHMQQLIIQDKGDKFIKTDINKIIHNALSLIGTQLKTHSINVILRLYNNLPLINVVPGQMEQVIVNLMFNAMNAMDAHRSVDKKISVETGIKGDNIFIEVMDTGPGIQQKHLSQVFNPFFTTKDDTAGTGMGLSIVYNIVSAFEGTITIDNSEHSGAVFTVLLPISSDDTVQK